jgi:hypothetical protein
MLLFEYNYTENYKTVGDFLKGYYGIFKPVKEWYGDFYCSSNIISLEGSPEKINGRFDCSYCDGLKSLKGCPKEVTGDFWCLFSFFEFKKEDIRKVCDVGGKIITSRADR